jgi:hypothetical protein
LDFTPLVGGHSEEPDKADEHDNDLACSLEGVTGHGGNLL